MEAHESPAAPESLVDSALVMNSPSLVTYSMAPLRDLGRNIFGWCSPMSKSRQSLESILLLNTR